MALSGTKCPDCGKTVREPFRTTMTGRKVCPGCARGYQLAMGVAATTGDADQALSVWAVFTSRLRRKK